MNVDASGWIALPVDGVGYVPAPGLLALSDDALRDIIEGMIITRYSGDRNYLGHWRDLMGLDELTGKDILEFGCGIGLEAMQLARNGNRVTVSDIHPENVTLAQRVCSLYGQEAAGVLLSTDPPRIFPRSDPQLFDVFYASGSLHHSPHPVPVMRQAAWLLRPDGEARLMLYSDRGWRIATGTEPPAVASEHPAFQTFLRFFDSVGEWADWYDADRLEQRFGQWFTLERFSYLTSDDRYCAAVMRRRS